MLRLAERIFVFFMLLYATGAIVPFLGAHGTSTAASKYEMAVQIPLYSAAAFFILLRLRTVWQSAWKTKWILALTVLAVASTAWSPVPLFTLRRSVILVATTSFGVYFGTRFAVEEQLRILARVCGIVVLLSFLFALFLPHYGIDPTFTNGSWRGVFAQKNSLGRVAVLSIIVFLLVQFRRRQWLAWAGTAGAFILLLFSKSATSVLVLASLLGILMVFKVFRSRFAFAVPVCSFGILALGILAVSITPDQLLHYVHRDAGLTGRTRLWSLSLKAVARQPWFGYGFKSFWLGMKGASATLVQQLHWSPPSGHNGFLDITLEVGIVGLALFVIGYLLLWRRALQFLIRDRSHVPVWLGTYLFFMLVYNFSERTILEQNTVFWMLYVSAAVNLYLDLPPKAKSPEPAPAPKYGFQAAIPSQEPA
jgi:exopolysaccharide production protein ExoQ